MKAVSRPKRGTAKSRTSFRGANNGLCQTTREIIQERQEGDAPQRFLLEVLSPIRQDYTISAGTFGNGASTPIKAMTVHRVAIGACCAVVPGPQGIVSKCSPLTEM